MSVQNFRAVVNNFTGWSIVVAAIMEPDTLETQSEILLEGLLCVDDYNIAAKM